MSERARALSSGGGGGARGPHAAHHVGARPLTVSHRFREVGKDLSGFGPDSSDSDSDERSADHSLRRSSLVGDERTSLLGGDAARAHERSSRKAYFIFVMLGVGVLFPWNAFISAHNYFHMLYPNAAFEFEISLAYNYPSLVALFLSIRYGPHFSFSTRTLSGLLMSLFALGSVPFLSEFMPRSVSLITTLIVVFFTGIAVSVMFGGILGLASIFPPKFINAVMIGNGIAGILVAVLRITTLLAFGQGPNSARYSSYVYFALASSVLLVCIVLFVWLLRLPITRHYHAKHRASQRHSAGPPVEQRDGESVSVARGAGAGGDAAGEVGTATINGASDSDDSDGAAVERGSNAPGAKRKIAHFGVLLKCGRHAFCVFAVFFVTLSLFPGIVTKVPAREGGESWKFWFPILLLSLFMVFDWAGRSAPSYWRPVPERWLWLCAIARFAFFPLFALCIHPAELTQDWIPCLLVVLLAYTNGAWGTESMMVGPAKVAPHEREVAGVIMSFMLNAGIFFGVHFAVVMLYLLTGSTGISFKA